MSTANEPDAQGAHFTGGTTVIASRHDQRLSYTLYVPQDHTTEAAPLPLIVLQHGIARTAELHRNRWKDFAIAHRCVILAPLFPAGLTEPRKLDDFTVLAYGGIRFDEELLHIVDEVGERFNARSDRFHLHGFSAGGQFAHRFFYAHPGRLAGLSISAPGSVTPLGGDQPWWLGTADFQERFGVAIDLPALRRVPVQLVVGSRDTEALEPVGTLRRDYEEHGLAVRFDLVPGAAHEEGELTPAAQEFMADLLLRQ